MGLNAILGERRRGKMMAHNGNVPDPAVQTALSFLQNLLDDYQPRDFAVRMWDGTHWNPEPGNPTRFTLVLQHPGSLRKMFFPPNELTLGEAYIYDDFDVEGNMEAIFSFADYLRGLKENKARLLDYLWQILRMPSDGRRHTGRQAAQLSGKRHSIDRDKLAVTYHYDVPNEFYELWLDNWMVYSCAYFRSLDDDLDTAQLNKLDYTCRKLRLHSGERLLDIGCGWGGLIIHAVQHYGVDAIGITLSQQQADFANARIREAGLEDQCRVDVLDYRQLDGVGAYDKLVSIGMFEHVGESLLREYFERAWRLLRSGGIFLNHGIARRISDPLRRGPSFSDRYVFPDGELVAISQSLNIAEMIGFEVRDVESLREHYMHTLRHWVRRLEKHHAEASANGFKTGRLNVYQAVLVKPSQGDAGLPLTRTDLYP
jgi:cyclopropane-fatty-acyl-phospholipid synthase